MLVEDAAAVREHPLLQVLVAAASINRTRTNSRSADALTALAVSLLAE